MQFTNALAVAATLASAVSGATIPSHINERDTANGTAPPFFKLQVVAVTTPIHQQAFQAAHSSIWVGLPKQNATCNNTPDEPTENEATFYLDPQDGGLYLYGASATPQETYADRSGFGQGRFSYTTGAQPAPRNAERSGWVVDEAGYLTLNGSSFLACPNTIEGSYVIWVNAGDTTPGDSPNCMAIAARTVAIPKPLGCQYTPN
ncbi:cell wall protein PhiA [Colletotrichum somersetense]|nr:cell wall protein PhiA [Colletotrichum somersetense]